MHESTGLSKGTVSVRLGSKVLVVDCRPDSCIGAFFCRKLADVGLSVRCLAIDIEKSNKSNAKFHATVGLSSNATNETSPSYPKYACVLEHRILDIVLQCIRIPLNCPLLTTANNSSALSCSSTLLKDSLRSLIPQVTRVYVVLGHKPDVDSKNDGCGTIVSHRRNDSILSSHYFRFN